MIWFSGNRRVAPILSPRLKDLVALPSQTNAPYAVLQTVVASRMIRKMSVGRTGPILLEAEKDDGTLCEVACKFADGRHLTETGLAAEALCAMLAADLGLPVPEPHIVTLDDAFLDALRLGNPALFEHLQHRNHTGFGSALLPPGFANWMDALKPAGAKDQHVLRINLKAADGLSLERLTSAWSAIDDTRLQAYRAALPPAWDRAATDADEAIAFLRQLRDNVGSAIEEVKRVLA